MPDLVIFPDAVAIAASYLRNQLAGTTVTSHVPSPRPTTPFVTLDRVGGINRNPVVDEASVAVECWAAADQDAHDLAQRCRALLHAVVGSFAGASFVYRCDEVGGPARLPDPVSEQPRYVFTVSLAVRGTAELAS